MTNAWVIKNEDGTFRLVDADGEPLKMKWNIGGQIHENLISQKLEMYNLSDLKCYGVNIINFDDIC